MRFTGGIKHELARWLRTGTPAALRKQIARVARVIDGTNRSGIEIALERLRDRGVPPGPAIDVGAYIGRWTTLFRRIFPGSPVQCRLTTSLRTEPGGVLHSDRLLGGLPAAGSAP